MKKELKKVKQFKGRQMDGFSAVLYLNDVKVCDVINHGDGSAFYYGPLLTGQQKELLSEFQMIVSSLPPIKVDDNLSFEPDMDYYLSELLETQQVQVKLEKLYKNHIVFGIPGNWFELKKLKTHLPISELSDKHLQIYVNEIKLKLKPNEQILNTNLRPLQVGNE
jgi:hypothetical protein